MKIGFIGTGVMGTGIINNLLEAGHQVVVYNRTKSHAEEVISNGATWADSPADVARESEMTMTMVGYPKDVEDVWTRADGVFAGAKAGDILIDMTTSSPKLAQQLAQQGEAAGYSVLDAPVSGGDIGAKNGTLSIMVGGSKQAFACALPIFEVIGKQTVHVGSAGKGQHMKMSNNIGVAATVLTMAESMVYAKTAGLKLEDAYQIWSGGAASSWSVTHYMPRVMKNDFLPGFYVKHLLN